MAYSYCFTQTTAQFSFLLPANRSFQQSNDDPSHQTEGSRFRPAFWHRDASNQLYSRYDLRIKALIDNHKPTLLLDVGANFGQFCAEMFVLGFKGRLISFEAITHVHAKLTQTAKSRSVNWTVAPNCAIGDKEGSVDFHVTENFASSSMLDLTKYSLERSSALKETATLTVPTKRLDDLLPEMGVDPNVEDVFLKMDVQGAEDRVLAGAPTVIARSRIILCEVLLAPFYDGQADWRAIDAFLTGNGFALWDFEPVMRSDTSGRLEAADMVYVRRDRM